MYRFIASIGLKLFEKATLFRYGFNWSPMYRRTTGRLRRVSRDLLVVDVEIPRSWKNINYVGSIFGGSMLAATDPILMVQLIQILGDRFVVWDKEVQFRFRRPGVSTLRVRFEYTRDEVDSIRRRVASEGEIDIEKSFELVDTMGRVVAVGKKTLYVSDKERYEHKRAEGRRARIDGAAEGVAR